MSETPELEWKMTIDAGALRVDYRVTNTTDHQVLVAEVLLVRAGPRGLFLPAPGQLVVQEKYGHPGEAQLTLGAVGASVPTPFIVSPIFRPLDAGQSVSRTARLALPLKTWHNDGGSLPFSAEPRTATLTIQYLPEPPPRWQRLASATEDPLEVPAGEYVLRILQSGPLTIPSP